MVKEKLYKIGFDLSEMLVKINDAVSHSSIDRLDEWIISKCRNQIHSMNHNLGSYEQLSGRYFSIANNIHPYDEKLINDLDGIYLKAISELGVNNSFIAVGYTIANNKTCLSLIEPPEWVSLKINKEENIAYTDDREYWKVKFNLFNILKYKLTPSELEELNAELAVTNRDTQSVVMKDEVNSQADNKANKRNCQLHIFIWRVYQALNKSDKKISAQVLWNEIQHRYLNHDTESIIQEVTTDSICWCSGYGHESKLSRSSFDKTLSTIKKNPPF